MLGALTACSDDAKDDGPTIELSKDARHRRSHQDRPDRLFGRRGLDSANRQGGEAAAKYINENGGGINGHKIDLVLCNQQEDPASATKCINEFVEKKVAVIAVPLTAQGAVMLPIAARAGIPYVSQAPVSAVEMGAPGDYALRWLRGRPQRAKP